MELQKKLLLIISALLLGSMQSAHGQDPEYLKNVGMPANIDTSLDRGYSWDWNASGSLDSNVGQLQGFDNLGDKIQVRNLRVNFDFLYSVFGARVGLEDTYENSLKVDASDLEEKVKDLYIGIQPTTNTVILFGRTDIPFGDNVTQRAIDINDPIRRLNIDNERHVVASIKVSPDIIKEILKTNASLEVAAFNQERDPSLRLKDSDHMNSYSARLKLDFSKIINEAQVSYMKLNDGSHQSDVSVRTQNIGPLMPYAEVRVIRKDQVYGDTDVGTAGVAMAAWGGKIYAEGSHMKVRKSNFLENKTQNNATLGYTHPINKYIDGSLEGTTNVINKKDKTVMASVSIHRADKSTDNLPLFSTIAAKKQAQ